MSSAIHDDFNNQEQKEIVVRQAAFYTLFDLPYQVDYFNLCEHSDILEKMTQIDWNLHTNVYEAYSGYDASSLLQKVYIMTRLLSVFSTLPFLVDTSQLALPDYQTQKCDS